MRYTQLKLIQLLPISLAFMLCCCGKKEAVQQTDRTYVVAPDHISRGEVISRILENPINVQGEVWFPKGMKCENDSPTVQTDVKAASAKEFRYLTSYNNQFNDMDYYIIDSKGKVTFTFARFDKDTKQKIWKSVSFSLTPSKVEELKKMVDQVTFFTLPKSCFAPVYDGFHRLTAVEVDGIKKSVYLDNCIPKQMVPLCQLEYRLLDGKANLEEAVSAKAIDIVNYGDLSANFPK